MVYYEIVDGHLIERNSRISRISDAKPGRVMNWHTFCSWAAPEPVEPQFVAIISVKCQF